MTPLHVAVARGYVDTPFRHQGRLPGVGLDCAGLVVCALRACGIEVRDVRGYARIPSRGMFLAAVREHCDEIAIDSTASGDLLMFAFRDEPQHIAILDDTDIIHAYQAAGRVCKEPFAGIWRERLRAAFRVRC